MPKDDWVYLEHMLETSERAAAKVRGLSRREFDQDENLRLALTHLLQTIGEAARKVSADGQAKIDMPWRSIIGMRHKVVHDYLDVDEDIVWSTVTEELEPLIKQLRIVRDQSES